MGKTRIPVREHLAQFYREVFEKNKRYPEFDPRATEFFLNVIRTADLARAVMEKRMRAVGLTAPSFGVLMLLRARREGMSMGEIGKRFLVTRANITGLVDTLERRGLVERRPHGKDRRVILIRMTAKARQKLERILPSHFSFIAGLMAEIPPLKRRRAVEALEGLRTALLVRKGAP